MALITTVAEIAVTMMMWKSPPQCEGDYYAWLNVEPNQSIHWVNQELGLQKHTT